MGNRTSELEAIAAISDDQRSLAILIGQLIESNSSSTTKIQFKNVPTNMLSSDGSLEVGLAQIQNTGMLPLGHPLVNFTRLILHSGTTELNLQASTGDAFLVLLGPSAQSRIQAYAQPPQTVALSERTIV